MEYIDSSQAGTVVDDGEVLVEPAVLVGPREGRAKRRTFTAEFKRRVVAVWGIGCRNKPRNESGR